MLNLFWATSTFENMVKYIDSLPRGYARGIYAHNFAFSFRGPLKPVIVITITQFHIKTAKPFFIFCVTSGMIVSVLTV